MSKIKFKDILKEAAWDHTSGKSLPTLADVQKAYEAKKHLQPVNEGSDVVRKLVAELNNELIEQPWVKTDSRTLSKVLTKVIEKAVKQKIIDEGGDGSTQLEESPNTWRRMDGLHSIKLMNTIEKAALKIAQEFAEEGFEANDVRSWFDRALYMNVVRKTKF